LRDYLINKERGSTSMNSNVLRIIAQAAISVAQIFIEKWIETKERSRSK